MITLPTMDMMDMMILMVMSCVVIIPMIMYTYHGTYNVFSSSITKKQSPSNSTTTTPYDIYPCSNPNNISSTNIHSQLQSLEDIQSVQSQNQQRQQYGKKYLICIDWDDTLMSTSRLEDNFDNPPLDIIQIANPMYNLLQTLIINYGAQNIKIVTNSVDGWCFNSLDICSKISIVFMQIKQLLIAHNIEIISAQSRYRYPHYPKSEQCNIWKRLAFQDIFREKFRCQYRKRFDDINIITIGDNVESDHFSAQMALHLNNYYFCYNVKHHQIVVRNRDSRYDIKDCKYFAYQLNYITHLLIDYLFDDDCDQNNQPRNISTTFE